MNQQRFFGSRFVTVIALVIPAVLFWLTLYPGVGGRLNPGASAKLQFIGHVLGVPEAPGYPQYVLLNYLWTSLPLPGSLAMRVNLLSMVCALVAAGIFLATARQVTRDRIAALLGLWVVLLSHTIWSLSTETNTATLHLVYVAAILFSGTAWLRERQSVWLLALLSTFALGLGNDTAIVALLPAVILLVAIAPPRRPLPVRWPFVLVGVAVLGVGQYALLWWRSHAGAQYLEAVSENASLAEVVEAALATSIRAGDLLRSGLTNLSVDLLIEANTQLLLPAVMVAAWGFAVLCDRKPTLAWFWGLAWLSGVVHVSAYETQGWSVYCAPVWLITGLFLAVGLSRALELRDGLSIAAVFAVVVGLGWTVPSNFSDLRVAETPYDLSLLIRMAGSDGIVITRDRRSYEDEQIRNYYRFGLDTAVTGPWLLTAGQLLARPNLLLSDRTIYYRNRPEILQTDVVPVFPVREWVSGLKDGTLVAVIATDNDSSIPPSELLAVREEIADALEPLGIGAPLKETGLPLAWYVALAVKGSPASGFELTHPTDAILSLSGNEASAERLRAFFEDHRFFANRSEPFQLYAGRAREGIYNRLTLGDREDLSRRPEIRIFAIEPNDVLDYQVVRFDSKSRGAVEPYYYVTGTTAPVESLSIIEAETGAPVIARASMPLIAEAQPDVIAVVVGCLQRRLKVARTFSLEPSSGDLRRLRRFVHEVMPGDWLTLALKKPPTAAAQETVNRVFQDNGLPEQDWETIESSLVIVTRVGTLPLQLQIYQDPKGTMTANFRCTPIESADSSRAATARSSSSMSQ